jgi:hypothetical protein
LNPAIARGKVYLGQAQRTSAMYKLTYGIVRHQPRKVVHVVRNVGEDVAAWEIDQIIETVRERMLSRHVAAFSDTNFGNERALASL